MSTVISPLFKKTAYLLGMFSLLSVATGGEAKADGSKETGISSFHRERGLAFASACAPDEDSIDYQLSGAGVSFPGSVTGDITLRCNVTNVMDPDFPWSNLEVVYSDPDGSGTTDQVKVTLHKVDLNGTAESVIPSFFDPFSRRILRNFDPSLLATFDSNTTASAASGTQVHTAGIDTYLRFRRKCVLREDQSETE